MHSTASDGTYSPQEIIDIAVSSKMVAIAITDHDNINGYFEASKYSQEKGVDLFAGVEVNTDAYDTEIDILGYFWDPVDQIFLDMINAIGRKDSPRQKYCEKLGSWLRDILRPGK